jgi:hypothetical protein
MDEVIYPLLDKLSMMWIAGSVKGVHENFINNIIRRKLSVEIDKLDFGYNENSKKFLVYLPEYEAHELTVLYVFYLLKKNNANTLYLGTQVSIGDVKDGIDIYKPDYIFTLFNDSFSESPLQPYIDNLVSISNNSKILITGLQSFQQKLVPNEKVTILNNVNEIKSFINVKYQDA